MPRFQFRTENPRVGGCRRAASVTVGVLNHDEHTRNRGFGRHRCCHLQGAGCARRHVVLHYQSDRPAAEATRQVMEGGGHTIIQADLSNPTSIERLWQEASALKRIDAARL